MENTESLTQSIYRGDGQLNETELLTSARVLFKNGAYQESQKIFHALLREKRCTDASLLGLARCHEMLREDQEAHRAYERAIQYSPTSEALMRFSLFLFRKKSYYDCLDILERALRVPALSQADQSAIETYIAECLLEIGRPGHARDILRKLIPKKPQNSRLLRLEARSLLKVGTKREAFQALLASLSVEINQADLILEMLKLAYDLRLFSPAIGLVENYLQCSPFNSHILFSLAGLYYHEKDYASARATLNTLLGLLPGHEGARKLLELIQSASTLNIPGRNTENERNRTDG